MPPEPLLHQRDRQPISWIPSFLLRHCERKHAGPPHLRQEIIGRQVAGIPPADLVRGQIAVQEGLHGGKDLGLLPPSWPRACRSNLQPRGGVPWDEEPSQRPDREIEREAEDRHVHAHGEHAVRRRRR